MFETILGFIFLLATLAAVAGLGVYWERRSRKIKQGKESRKRLTYAEKIEDIEHTRYIKELVSIYEELSTLLPLIEKTRQGRYIFNTDRPYQFGFVDNRLVSIHYHANIISLESKVEFVETAVEANVPPIYLISMTHYLSDKLNEYGDR